MRCNFLCSGAGPPFGTDTTFTNPATSSASLSQFPFSPNQWSLRVDVIEPVEHELASTFEPEKFICDRAVFPVDQLPASEIWENDSLGVIFDLRKIGASIVDPVPQKDASLIPREWNQLSAFCGRVSCGRGSGRRNCWRRRAGRSSFTDPDHPQ